MLQVEAGKPGAVHFQQSQILALRRVELSERPGAYVERTKGNALAYVHAQEIRILRELHGDCRDSGEIQRAQRFYRQKRGQRYRSLRGNAPREIERFQVGKAARRSSSQNNSRAAGRDLRAGDG